MPFLAALALDLLCSDLNVFALTYVQPFFS